ncbi:MAG: amidohydrolase [Acidobacteria bacterium]|nr:MAG: amidohydrolase [Acidobacteriota bacterium]
MRARSTLVLAALLAAAAPARGQAPAATAPLLAPLDALAGELDALYVDLHRTPELSFREERTAARMAARLAALGFDVTTGVGGTGVVGVLGNGPGPTVMLRTDLDGLPVQERTGLLFASRATAVDPAGATVGVMHACGHDLHMTAWVGAATLLSRGRDRWSGTLVMVGQPAEERGSGARAMLADGLFTRFPRPDFALALHAMPSLPAGSVGIGEGPVLASVDSVDVTIHGRGGHGAMPHQTVDPIVIAARTVLALQTIVSRERSPFDPVVVTVGSFHAGTKHNVVPDEARLQLTVRAYSPATREKVLASIERIVRAEAEASAAPRPPEVKVSEPVPATVNDAALARRVRESVARALPDGALRGQEPVTAAEDFAEYGRAGVPSVMFWLGSAPPALLEASERGGPRVPPLHSAEFAPDRVPATRAGVTALVAAALDLLGRR